MSQIIIFKGFKNVGSTIRQSLQCITVLLLLEMSRDNHRNPDCSISDGNYEYPGQEHAAGTHDDNYANYM